MLRSRAIAWGALPSVVLSAPGWCVCPHGSAPLLPPTAFSWLWCVGLGPHSHRLSFKEISCTNLTARKRHELFLGAELTV